MSAASTSWLVTGAKGQLGTDLQELLAGARRLAGRPARARPHRRARGRRLRGRLGRRAVGAGPGVPQRRRLHGGRRGRGAGGARAARSTARRRGCSPRPAPASAQGWCTSRPTTCSPATPTEPYAEDATPDPQGRLRSHQARRRARPCSRPCRPPTSCGRPGCTAPGGRTSSRRWPGSSASVTRSPSSTTSAAHRPGPATWPQGLLDLVERRPRRRHLPLHRAPATRPGAGWRGRSSRSSGPTRRGCSPRRPTSTPCRPRARRTACSATPGGTPPAYRRRRTGETALTEAFRSVGDALRG